MNWNWNKISLHQNWSCLEDTVRHRNVYSFLMLRSMLCSVLVMHVPFSVFCVFVCKCVLHCCQWVSTQLRLNIYIDHIRCKAEYIMPPSPSWCGMHRQVSDVTTWEINYRLPIKKQYLFFIPSTIHSTVVLSHIHPLGILIWVCDYTVFFSTFVKVTYRRVLPRYFGWKIKCNFVPF
jgi:hypothetical protein